MIIGIPKVVVAARLFAGKDDENAEVPQTDDPDWVEVTHAKPYASLSVSDVLWTKNECGDIRKAFYFRLPGSYEYKWIDRYKDELLNDVCWWRSLINGR